MKSLKCLLGYPIFSGLFSFSVLITVSSPIHAALTSSEQELADALDAACSDLLETQPPLIDENTETPVAARDLVAESNLTDACIALSDVTPETFEDAISELIPTQVPAQGTSSVEISNRQFDNITSRMAALRSGATGISAAGLTMRYKDLTLPGILFTDSAGAAGGGSAGQESTSLAGKLGLFINGSVGFGDKDSSSNELGFDFDTKGLTAGADYRLSDKFILGGAVGYVDNETDFDSDRGSMDVDGYTLSVYATYYHDENTYLDAIASVGWNDFDNSRLVDLSTSGIPLAEVKGDTDGLEYTLSVGGGYDFSRNGFNFGPFARVNFINVDIDSYTEDTSTGFEFAYDDQDLQSLTTLLGGQVSYAFSTTGGVFTPQLRFEWAHEFKDDSRFINARFSNDPTQTQFRLRTDNPDRNYFNLGIGLSATFAEGKSAFIYYESMLEHDDVAQQSVAAGVRLTF